MMLNPLHYIDEVARCGSIRVAADRLNIAPSAISRHIRNLEEEMGQQLFERHPRGVVLTEAGQLFLRYIRQVLLSRDRVRSEIEDLKGLRRGRIRIHSVDGVVAGPLSDAIAAFQKRYPGVTLQLISTGTEMVTKAVHDGDADVGIAFHAIPEPGVEVRHRISDPLVAVVSPKHTLAKFKSVTLAKALSYPFAIPVPSFGIRRLIESRCRTEHLVLQPALETNSIEALRGFARSNAGVTMLPANSTRRDVDLGMAVAVPFKDAPLRQSALDICVQKGRVLPPAVSEFADYLHKMLKSKIASVRA